jgi:hypothetical protein
VIVVASVPPIGSSWLPNVERLASAFAKRKTLVLWVVPLASIAVRLALLPLSPVPVPAVHDEFAYLLGADTFTHGRLANPPHPMSVFFETFHVLQHPVYASQYPPAQSVVLAIGKLLGHPWIGVLLSMAAMTAAITWMLQGWFPPQWALLGGLTVLSRFSLASYWVNSYWGGAVAATGAALVLGAFPRVIHRQRLRDSIYLGLGAAVLANSRPFEGFIFCLPVAAFLAIWLFSSKSPVSGVTWSRVVLPVLCILALTLLFIGYYNWRITGKVLLFPETLAIQRYDNTPLFVWEPRNPPLHYTNPQFDYFYNTIVRDQSAPTGTTWRDRSTFFVLGVYQMFLGTILSISFIMLWRLIRDRRMRLLWLQFCLSGAGLLAVVYLQPHYAAPLVATIFALWVQSMRHLRRAKLLGRPVGIGLSRAIILASLISSAIFLVEAASAPKDPQAWNLSRARFVQQLDATPGLHLIIVRYQPNHYVHHDWVYNAADIDHSKIVWAREIPGRDIQPLLAYFHDRKVWLVDADASPPRLRPYSGQ